MKKTKSVITTLDTRSDLKKTIDGIRMELEDWLELEQIRARLAKEQYDYLIEEGFTEQQAMQIITTQPSWK